MMLSYHAIRYLMDSLKRGTIKCIEFSQLWFKNINTINKIESKKNVRYTFWITMIICTLLLWKTYIYLLEYIIKA